MTVHRLSNRARPVAVVHLSEASVEDRRREVAVWSWLTQAKRQLIVERSFQRVCRHNALPPGQPFVEGGVEWSSPAEFAEQLADEIRDRLFELLADLGLEEAE